MLRIPRGTASRVVLAIFAATAAIAAVLVVVQDRVVLILPDQVIEKYLLRRTPIGTSEGDVRRWLAAREVAPREVMLPMPASAPWDRRHNRPRGVAFIRVSLGYYRLFFRRDIVVFYVFDGSGSLVDIQVRKDVDSL
jgi:hypothetical protein